MSDIQTQRRVLAGDPISSVIVAGENKPSLYLAIRDEVIGLMEGAGDSVPNTVLLDHIKAPVWYGRTSYDIGVTMRTIGYYRHGDVWRYNVKSAKHKKVERWKLPGRSDLKTLRLEQVAKLHTMVENELKRRGR